MKSNSEKYLFIAGLALLLVAVLSMVAGSLLIADGCTKKCGPNTYECSSGDTEMVCSCSGNVDGVYWSHLPVRHSETGYLSVSQKDVTCFTVYSCLDFTLDEYSCDNSAPVGETPVYRCGPADGSECNKALSIEVGEQKRQSCVLEDCDET